MRILLTLITLLIFTPTILNAADGKVITYNSKALIKAPFNGSIEEIYVRPNVKVNENQPLLKLNDSTFYNEKKSLQGDYLKLLADEARLNAFLRDKSSIMYPIEISQSIQERPQLKKYVESQKIEFNKFISDQQDFQKELDSKNSNLDSVILGIKERLRKAEADLAKVTEAENIALKRIEVPYGRYKVDYIRNIKVQVQLKVDSIRLELQKVKDQISANNAAFATAKKEFKDKIRENIPKIQSQIKTIKIQIAELDKKISQTQLISPSEGIVTFPSSLKISQEVNSGQILGLVTPKEYTTVVEINSDPNDLKFKKDEKVRVNFLQPDIPELTGEVTYITPGTVRVNGEDVLIIYIKVQNKDLDEYPDLIIQPGMPVEVN